MSVIIAKTPTAPAMHSDHVAGRFGFSRRYRIAKMIKPITNSAIDQINRPAGRIHGNQSGIRLGIGPVVLREHRGRNGVWRFPITLSERGAHRGVVAQWVRVRFAARRCTDERDLPDHKRTSTSAGMSGADVWDALVVGGGPSGAATGHWLARAGHRVLVV